MIALRLLAAAPGLAGLALLALGLRIPWPGEARARFASHPRPCATYDEAVRRAASASSADPAGLEPACGTRLLAHGHRTQRSVVLLHGFTNCPQQCDRLAEQLFGLGCNVFVPLQPHHGLADRMTGDLARLRAGELIRAIDEAVDIARGLGDRVTVLGLSMGGVQAAWAAQQRGDVDDAVLVAPLCGLAVLPPALTRAAHRVLRAAPNAFPWWDPRLRANLPGPKQVYPRYSTRALGEILLLADFVEGEAERAAPRVRVAHVVLSGSDLAVSAGAARGLAERWRRRGARVEVFEFPAALRLGHDLIDPAQPSARPDVTYPVLLSCALG